MEFEAGNEVGGYRLLSRIGVGGMGEVWKAEDKRLGRTVAIKILPASLEANADSKARLEREARTAAQLYHPNIATIHSMDETHGRSYIVMEFVEGQPLSKSIRAGRMSEAEVCRIGRQIAEALAEAHERGIVHRDIKPDNILMTGTRVKVLDFGIAKQIGVSTTTGEVASQNLTQTGMIIGTVQYMSPEQALGRPLDARTDLFSLGVVLYQMLSGELPFQGETITETLTQIIRDEPVDISQRVPGTTPALAAIVRRCMQKKKEQRYADARTLSDELGVVFEIAKTKASNPALERTELMIGSTDPTVLSPRQPKGATSRAWWPIALAVVLVLATALLFAARMTRRARIASSEPPLTVAAPVKPSPAPAPATTVDVVAPSTIIEKNPAPTSTFPPSSVAPVMTSAPAAIPATPMTTAVVAAAQVDALFQQGMTLLLADHANRAREQFNAVLAIDPHHAKARLRMGELHLVEGKRDDGREEFLQAQADRDQLDPREQLLAQLGLAIANRNRARVLELGVEFNSRYPGDAEAAMLRQIAEERLADSLDDSSTTQPPLLGGGNLDQQRQPKAKGPLRRRRH